MPSTPTKKICPDAFRPQSQPHACSVSKKSVWSTDITKEDVIEDFKRHIIGYLAASLVVIILLFFGFSAWPGLHWDAAFFPTVDLNVARYNKWTFGGYTEFLNLYGTNKYTFHGLLQGILFGKILRTRSWEHLHVCLGFMNSGTFLTYLYLYKRALERQNISTMTIAVMFAIVPVVIMLGIQGRPEYIMLLLIALPFLVYELTLNFRLAMYSAYIVCPLMFLASPLPGGTAYVIVFLILFSHFSARRRSEDILKQVFILACTSLLILLSLLHFFTPFTLSEWLHSLLSAGSNTKYFEGKLSMIFELRMGLSMVIPLWNSIVLVFLYFILTYFLDKNNPILFFSIVALALFMNLTMADYGYAPFIPLIFLVAIDRVRYGSRSMLSRFRTRYLLYALMAIAIVYTYVFSQYTIQALVLNGSGQSLTYSRQRLNKLAGNYMTTDNQIAIGFPALRTPSLISLGDASVGYVDFPFSLLPAGPSTSLLSYEKLYKRRVIYYILPVVQPVKRDSLPQAVFIGNRRFSLLDADSVKINTNLANLVKLERIKPAYAFALYKAIDS